MKSLYNTVIIKIGNDILKSKTSKMADQIEMSTAESTGHNFFRQNVNFFGKAIPVKTTFTFSTTQQNAQPNPQNSVGTDHKTKLVQVNTTWTPYMTSMAKSSDRANTFISWPRQMVQKPSQLVASGFFYTGRGDVVQCFFCSIHLKHWETSDRVDVEHRKHSPDCKFHVMNRFTLE